MLLDRLDELPLRRHEIRGNPAGLLARLLRRIDALKAEAVTPGRLRDWAEERERDAQARGRARASPTRARVRRPLRAPRPRSCARRAASTPATWCSSSERLLGERADVRGALAERFPFVMVDELEDAGAAHRALLEALAAEHGNLVCACDLSQAIRRPALAVRDPAPSFMDSHPDAEQVVLDRPLRFGAAIARAAAAVAALRRGCGRRGRRRADGRGLGGGAGQVLALQRRARAGPGGGARDRAPARGRRGAARGRLRDRRLRAGARRAWSRRRSRSAASRSGSPATPPSSSVPRCATSLAWLRMLADPTDSAAVVRALTRPPVELRSVDLARCTTIARRRKLDMISALEAALESPQLPPEARDRIQAFLKLHRAAVGGAGGDARRRLRAAPDRAHRPAPPSAVRRQPRDRRAAVRASRAWPSSPPPGRAASRAARRATSSAT